MNKRNIILSIVLVIIFIVTIGILYTNSHNNNDKKVNKDEEIINLNEVKENIKDNNTFYIYISDRDDIGDFGQGIFDSFKEVYNIETIVINGVDDKNKLKKFAKVLKYDYNDLLVGSTFFVNKGHPTSFITSLDINWMEEQILKDDTNYKREYNLSEEVFNKLNSSKDRYLIIWVMYDIDSIKYRKKLRELAGKNNFDFYDSYNQTGGYEKSNLLFSKTIKEYKYPTLFIVSNNSIIDYKEIKTNKDIDEFLKKNKFIS